jgi:hypothetical protein
MRLRPKLHRINLAAVGAIVALALPAGASAGPLVAEAKSCDTQILSQPFLPWADPAYYTLDPGGSFEAGGPAWSGGRVVPGNEPFHVGPPTDSMSLALAAGASTVSRSLCVGLEHPDLRFFAKASSPLAKLNVEVLFEDASGNVLSALIGVVSANNGWALTPTYPIVANLLPLMPGSKTAVAFRFTAAEGDWQIDDVYVDPYTRW